MSLRSFSGCEDLSALGFGVDARAGRGPGGRLLERTNAVELVQNNEARIREYATGLGTPALNVLRGASTAIVATVTIFVLAYLAVLEGPKVVTGTLALLPPQRAKRIQRVTHDCAKTVTGYISGNLLISAICGTLTYAVLKISGVPFAGLIAVFVAIADLIPLVGATSARWSRPLPGSYTPCPPASPRSSSSSSTSSWRTTCSSRSSSPAPSS